jgi:hypothetical protein
MDESEEYVIVWEAPVIEKPEFRLYYDDQGHVLLYTCEKLPGNYITVDTMTFAEARPDVRVVDGKIVKKHGGSVISRLYKDIEGVLTESEDVSIITDIPGQYWKLKTSHL